MTKLLDVGTVLSGATFGPLGLDDPYRYRLWRTWADTARTIRWLTFLMLNPSTATHEKDDPTITRCLGFARRWGYTGLEVLNIFALRSTDPGALYRSLDPIGPENDAQLAWAATRSDRVICGWGNHGRLYSRGDRVKELLHKHGVERYALRITKEGQPNHPLFLKADLDAVLW